MRGHSGLVGKYGAGGNMGESGEKGDKGLRGLVGTTFSFTANEAYDGNIFILFILMFYGYHRAKQEQMGHQVQMVQLDYR